MIRNYGAFTLAEVLVTLVIIGVIAAMTIPTLINKTEKQEFVSKLKKNYSVFSSALKMAQAQNGQLTGWDWSSQQSGFDNIENYILPHLQVAENCKNTTNCSLDYDCKYLNGNSWFNFKTNTNQYKIALNDGSTVVFYPRPACVENHNQCIDIHFDVNGSKGPNKRGRDIFSIIVYPFTNDIQANGIRADYNAASGIWDSNSKSFIDDNCITSGVTCSAKIILEGYKMNY